MVRVTGAEDCDGSEISGPNDGYIECSRKAYIAAQITVYFPDRKLDSRVIPLLLELSHL